MTGWTRNVLIACGIGLALGGSAMAQEATEGRVMLVLDASGSMWGQIEGRSKVEIAREVVADILADWNPAVEIGLVAYGHRRKGDCADIETLIPAGPLDRDRFLATVNGLNAVGKTPLSQAVIDAAAALRSAEDKATVILVSDGEETCERDPCAVGNELETSGVDFTAHVIGFDVADPVHQAQLQCLAENTGGTFLTAANASELRQALETVVAATAAPPPPPEPAPAPPQPAEPETGAAVFTAEFSRGGEMANANIAWTLHKDDSTSEDLGEQVDYTYGAEWRVIAPPGRYVVQAEIDGTKAQMPVEITGAPQRVTVTLDAGVLRPFATLTAGGPALTGSVAWEVLPPTGDEHLVYSYDAEPQWILPAGHYRVHAEFGDATGAVEVDIEPGKAERLELVMAAGVLRAVAVMAPGGPAVPGSQSWEVVKAEESLTGEHEQVAVAWEPEPQFTVPAGDYLVTVEAGAATATMPVTVAAGTPAEVEVVLNAGVLNLTAPGAVEGEGISWEIVAAEADLLGNREQIAVAWDPAPQLVVPAGPLIVTVEQGARQGQSKVVVTAGQATTLEVPLR